MFFKCFEIESMMNRAGAEKVPFLFGLDFELQDGFFIENPMLQSDILFEVEGVGNYKNMSCSDTPHITHANKLELFPEDYSTYKKRFDIVMEGLSRGDSYLANLTIRTPISTSLSMIDIFKCSSSPYKLYVPQRFVCFSPECFVKIDEGVISTYPMKGTIDADIADAEQIILNNEKEKAEHNTIVDLLRNDLSKVAENVFVKRFRYIDRVNSNRGSLLQVSSEIVGTLGDSYLDEIGSVIFKLLPAGSVSGAPKDATIDIIRKAEQIDRGYYSGISGYYDGKSMNSFVLIRFIEQVESNLFFRSGGGITAMSVAENEYREAIQKVYLPF